MNVSTKFLQGVKGHMKFNKLNLTNFLQTSWAFLFLKPFIFNLNWFESRISGNRLTVLAWNSMSLQ